MNSKPENTSSRTPGLRPARKVTKGTTETARLFIDVTQVIRKTQAMPLTRYVE